MGTKIIEISQEKLFETFRLRFYSTPAPLGHTRPLPLPLGPHPPLPRDPLLAAEWRMQLLCMAHAAGCMHAWLREGSAARKSRTELVAGACMGSAARRSRTELVAGACMQGVFGSFYHCNY